MVRRHKSVTLTDTLLRYTTCLRSGRDAYGHVLLGRAAVDHSRGQRGENTDIGRRGQYAKGQSGRLLALFHPDPGKRHAGSRGGGPVRRTPQELGKSGHRSEEHTSELQSLMRNSYAVLCLKKK